MTKNECRTEIVSILKDTISVNISNIDFSSNKSLFDDFEMDSLSIIGFVVEIEQRFDISIEELEDLSVFETIDSSTDFVYQYINS